MSQKPLSKIFLAIPVIVGIVIGLFLVLNISEDNPEPSKLTARSLTEGGSPIMGESSAEITILEWGDYQCTYCYKFHSSTLKVIEENYIKTGKVKLVFKDFTLNGPDSVLAAEAAYCAGDQKKFWQYHDQLYENWAGERTGWINRDSLDRFANAVGLNLEEFNNCIDSKKYNQKVLDLYAFGQEIEIDATPSFLIFNDEKIIKIRGNQPLEAFIKAIEEL